MAGMMIRCISPQDKTSGMTNDSLETDFAKDIHFLEKYLKLIILENDSGGRVAVSPDLQGRVMTSTAGLMGNSYGWINRSLFESGDTLPHMNAFGGEERFWLGPEGGQFSIFFKKDDPFDLDHWQTPRLIDLDHYPVIEQQTQKVIFEKDANLVNYGGYSFKFTINRSVEILPSSTILRNLGIPEGLANPVVGYQTINKITNTGDQDWQEETGLLSIWLLGMYNPSSSTTVIIPYQTGPEGELGPVVNDAYFGKVAADRLIIKEGVIYFRGDGRSRGKIGLNPKRAKNICGAYDAENKVLTIVKYNKPDGKSKYVNSLWEIQDQPYTGDVINSYNDGPPDPGKAPLGPFYEVETSSPALALKKGESGIHIQETYHFEGDEESLGLIMQKTLGVSIEEVKASFK